jgi:MYXO-CTERM domain-containing protein
LSYVAGTGLNLSYFAAEMFTANNRRAEGEWMPPDDDGGGEGGSEGGSEDGGDESDAGGTDDDGGDEGSDGDASDDGDGEDEGGDGPDTASAGFADEHVPPSGCQCSAEDRPFGALGLWVLALTAHGTRRRRRCLSRA